MVFSQFSHEFATHLGHCVTHLGYCPTHIGYCATHIAHWCICSRCLGHWATLLEYCATHLGHCATHLEIQVGAVTFAWKVPDRTGRIGIIIILVSVLCTKIKRSHFIVSETCWLFYCIPTFPCSQLGLPGLYRAEVLTRQIGELRIESCWSSLNSLATCYLTSDFLFLTSVEFSGIKFIAIACSSVYTVKNEFWSKVHYTICFNVPRPIPKHFSGLLRTLCVKFPWHLLYSIWLPFLTYVKFFGIEFIVIGHFYVV